MIRLAARARHSIVGSSGRAYHKLAPGVMRAALPSVLVPAIGGSVTVTVAVRRQWLCLNLGHAACRTISPQGMLVLGANWIGLGPDSDPGGWDDRDEIIHQNRR